MPLWDQWLQAMCRLDTFWRPEYYPAPSLCAWTVREAVGLLTPVDKAPRFMPKILCVDDQSTSASVFEEALWHGGYETLTVSGVQAALDALAQGGIDVIIADLSLPDAAGLEFLSVLEKQEQGVPLIVATSYANILSAVSSVRAGVIQYIAKPIQPQQLELAVTHALEFARLRRENARLQNELTQLRSVREIIGESLPLKRVVETLRRVAPTRSPVLVQGEPGTGKELLARVIHNLSPRREQPFMTINCATLPESLVERTLFGYEKGAFAGAVSRVKGALERSYGGTLLLDEVSAMPTACQSKLLRVVADQEFERVGGTDPIEADVRIIASTRCDLGACVQNGSFLEDLHRRLAAVRIEVPPLRSRRADIPLLAQHFAEGSAAAVGKPHSGIAPEAMQILQNYDWPGNVRELAVAVERAVILSPDPCLGVEALDSQMLGPPRSTADETPATVGTPEKLDEGISLTLPSLNVAEAEMVLIQRALEITQRNRTRAAELLGVSTRTLRNKLNKENPTPSGSA